MDPTILQIVLDELGWDDMDPDDVEGIRERAEEDVDAFEEVVHSVMDTSSFTLVDERDLAVEDHWNTLGVPLARLAEVNARRQEKDSQRRIPYTGTQISSRQRWKSRVHAHASRST